MQKLHSFLWLSGIPLWTSLVVQRERIHLPRQEMWVWSLGQEDPLEKEGATHSSILAWEIPGRLQPIELQRVRHDLGTKQQQQLKYSIIYICVCVCVYVYIYTYMYICVCIYIYMGFPGSSVVKNLSAMKETRVWSLGQEDPLEEGILIHSSILAWRIPRTEEPGGLQSTWS